MTWLRRTLTFVLVAAATGMLGGCSYLKNRTNDLFDVFRFDVGWGPALYAEARATDLVAVGLGVRYQESAGMHGRFVADDFPHEAVALGPFVFGSSGSWTALPILAGGTSRYDLHRDVVPTQILCFPLMGFGSCANDYVLSRRGLHVADLGADIAVGYVGLGVGVSPGEFLDLLLGLVGIDLARDDVFGSDPPPTSGTPAPASPESAR